MLLEKKKLWKTNNTFLLPRSFTSRFMFDDILYNDLLYCTHVYILEAIL